MLFMYIHTHSADNCKADDPEQTNQLRSKLQEAAQKTGIKFLGVYVAAHEHTIYSVIEADNLVALEQVLTPLTVWGDARLIPVISMQGG
jgi:selenophosphate synthetase-related protein